MNWVGWVGLAVVVTAAAAVAGLQPENARPVARTRMMGVARFVLLGSAVILAYVAFRAYSGG
jgi:hypothetical protein